MGIMVVVVHLDAENSTQHLILDNAPAVDGVPRNRMDTFCRVSADEWQDEYDFLDWDRMCAACFEAAGRHKREGTTP